MSFLSKLRGAGGNEKGKTSKKEWTPPKLPPAAPSMHKTKPRDVGTVLLSEQPDVTEAGCVLRNVNVASENPLDNPEDTSSSNKDADGRQDKENTAKESSPFSFLKEGVDVKLVENNEKLSESSGKSAFSFISGTQEANEPVKLAPGKKAEPSTRKKKKIATRPGYGNVDGSPSEILRKEQRSSSASSASETRSIVDEELKDDSFQSGFSHQADESHAAYESPGKEDYKPFSFITDDNENPGDSHIENYVISEDTDALPTDKRVSTNGGDNGESSGPNHQDGTPAKVDIDACDISGSNNLDRPPVRDDERERHAGEEIDIPPSEPPRQIHSPPSVLPSSVDTSSTELLSKTSRIPVLEHQDVDPDDVVVPKEDCKASSDLVNIDSIQNLENETGDRNRGSENKSFSNELIEGLQEVRIENSENQPQTEVSYELNLNQDEQTEIFLETLESREQHLRCELENMKETQVNLLQNIRKSFNLKTAVETEIQTLQEEQNSAIAKDDFALAEKINQRIDLRQIELENLKFQHPLLDRKIADLVSSCNKCLKNQLEECANLQNEFREIIQSEEKSLKQHTEQRDSKVFKARLKLNEEKAKLDREMGHISLDKEHLERNETQLDAEIDERTKSFETEKEAFLGQRNEVMIEIEDLEARLKILRSKESDINGKIESIDSQIHEIVLDFSPRLENLRKEKEDMIEKEADVKSKLENLSQVEDELNEKQERDQGFESRCRCNIDKLANKISTMKQTEEEINEENVDLESVVNFDLLRFSRSEEHKLLQKKVKKLAEELQGESDKVLDSSTQITRLRKIINDIEARVGELEKEKTLAVSGRNFKVAKRITEERNALISDGQQSQSKLKEVEDESRERNKVIEHLKDELKDYETILEKNELELDKKISLSLTDVISKLRNFGKGKKSSLWIMPFISFEITNCKNIIRDIHEKYSWPLPDVLTSETDDIGNLYEAPSEANVAADDLIDTSGVLTKSAKCDVEMIKTKIEDLESDLQQAVENEDYDKADELNSEIEKYKDMLAAEEQ